MLQITPKSARHQRILEEREPKLVENVKKSLILKGPKTSNITSLALKDLHKLKKPDSILLVKRNITRPFQDQSSLEFLCKQNDASLFAFGSHSKKRPHNLVIGRMFDYQLLDMLEFGIEGHTFKPMSEFESERKTLVRYGSKPLFIFNGDDFKSNPDFVVAKSLLLDFFRGEELQKINLASLDRVIICTAANNKIHFRHYGVLLKKSDSKLPRIELEEVGPTLDLRFNRKKSATEELHTEAMKIPSGDRRKRKQAKNVETGILGEKMGRVHMHHQDYTKIALNKGMKALRRKRKREGDEKGTQEGEGEGEKGGGKGEENTNAAVQENSIPEGSVQKSTMEDVD